LENTMQGLRGLSLDVLEQNIASRDTGPEYADLTSRRSYLESQRDRLEDLLELAASDTERQTLQSQQEAILSELASVEEQINTLWWAQHDAKLTIHLKPIISTPMPTLTRTPRPTSTPQPWDPGYTSQQARQFMTEIFSFPGIWIYLCCSGSLLLSTVLLMVLITRKRK